MMEDTEGLTIAFHAMRERLFGLAYRMLGSYADAEDVLQDTWLRLADANVEVKNSDAYLRTVVTRLCLDQLKSARVQREQYVGPWLPEPIIPANNFSPDNAAELADNLSFALLLTLEKLTPPERAAFLLHDVFERPFAEIADILGKKQSACRQLATRARKAVRSNISAQAVPSTDHEKLFSLFSQAISTGNADALKSLLRDDVIAYSDGGGLKQAALRPIFGADKVTRLFMTFSKNTTDDIATIRGVLARINGAPGVLIYINEILEQTLSVEITGNRISAIYMVRNPEKLRHLTRQ